MEKSTAFSSEGGFAPLPNLPPGTGCAGEAGARSGTPTGRGIFRGHVAFTLRAAAYHGNMEKSTAFSVMNSRRQGTPSCVFTMARLMAGTISPGSVTRSPWPPKARAMSA